MRVGILGGTGPEGRGLALRLGQAGVSVVIGSRNPAQAARKAGELQHQLEQKDSKVQILGQENSRVVETADLVFIAVPFEHAVSLLRSCLGRFRQGQIVVDVTVPLEYRGKRLELRQLSESSGSEHLEKILPEGLPLVAAFKTIPARLLADLQARLDCHVFICSDSEEARHQVAGVAARVPGLSPLDVGPLSEAATLERMAALAIQINRRHRVRFSRFRVLGL